MTLKVFYCRVLRHPLTIKTDSEFKDNFLIYSSKCKGIFGKKILEFYLSNGRNRRVKHRRHIQHFDHITVTICRLQDTIKSYLRVSDYSYREIRNNKK